MPSNTLEYRRAWTERNREHVNAYAREYRQRKRAENPDYDRDRYLRSVYRLSVEQADALLSGGCRICGGDATAIDHDHETGEVRGALCRTCNLGLGHFQDDPELLARAIEYLGPTRRT